MPRIKLPYKEGDWIIVPLEEGGYAVGRIARSRPGGKVLLGYFFGPKLEKIPNESEINHLNPEDAIDITQFGDLGLIEGEWPVIGNSDEWDRSLWPMPSFIRVDVMSGKARKIEYSEDDLLYEIRDEPATPEEVKKYPKDRVCGSGAVEIRLTLLLS